jgi:hypothetical protein
VGQEAIQPRAFLKQAAAISVVRPSMPLVEIDNFHARLVANPGMPAAV